jgi:hypothetical protein
LNSPIKDYNNSPKATKRAVVGTSTAGVNVLAAWFLRDIIGIDLPMHIALIVGGLVGTLTGWIYAGGIYNVIISFYQFKKKLREIKKDD